MKGLVIVCIFSITAALAVLDDCVTDDDCTCAQGLFVHCHLNKCRCHHSTHECNHYYDCTCEADHHATCDNHLCHCHPNSPDYSTKGLTAVVTNQQGMFIPPRHPIHL
ncbi:serine protease inhibitor Cvsi-1-like [Ostrea edulis]|uniref:serine protease inhibitor Cvsi-1-like n=1 Tax=Ostrea edulis TaxID=37623 RepID=UPI0024AED02B|nr:serine protease inhibitor Cvsi-1-like [Ostrea edulis]